MTPTEKRTILRAFWHKNRKTFVPLTQDELDEATGGLFSVHRAKLLRGGWIKTKSYISNGESTTICDVSETAKGEIDFQPKTRRRLTATPPAATRSPLTPRALP